MSYETELFVLTLAGSVVVAAAYLYIRDLLYTKATGRPASQRESDRFEKWNRDLTRSRYLTWSVFLGSAILLQAYLAVWGKDYKGWARLIPIGWMISGVLPFYHLQKRWRAKQASLPD